ncbi:MAG TPA: hydroxyacid dehydrogenase [Gemmatimonadota bacterium]|nr:hydroxyacid dehydrogenase [Gemmatimonadota bacterium]
MSGEGRGARHPAPAGDGAPTEGGAPAGTGAGAHPSRLRVVLSDPLEPEGMAVLEGEPRLELVDVSAAGPDALRRALGDAAGLVVRGATSVDEALLGRAPELRVVGRAGVGVDNVDLEACARRGIAVFNAPSGNTRSTAELTFGLLLAAARRIPEVDRSVREGRWERRSLRGVQLAGRRLGVVGVGRIGSAVAALGRAFGMDVLGDDPYLADERVAELERDVGVEMTDLDGVLGRADFVTLHVPLTDETRGMIGEAELGRMKPGSFLVNASRGGVVDEAALAEALRDGRLAGAALDVYGEEPPPSGSPLRGAPNLVLSAHLGGATPEARRAVAVEVATAVRDALVEGDLEAAVNAALL